MARRPLLLAASVVALALVHVAAAPAAAGVPDRPDTCAGATTTSASGPWHSNTIGHATDVDWYRFQTTATRHALITLGDLAEAYRVDLYSTCGTPLATSNRPGIQYEEIYRSLPAGTYRVRVWSPTGAFDFDPYVVRFRSLGEGVFVMSSSAGPEFGSNIRVAGEILNNTSVTREDVPVRVRYYDELGNQLPGGGTTFARMERLRPRQRSMFLWWGDPMPAGFHHHTATVLTAPVSSTAQTPGMVVHPTGASTDGFGTRHYTGTLENTNGFAVGVPRVMLTLYDGRGRVRNAEFVDTEPVPMPAHSSNAYEITLSNRHDANRAIYSAHAYRSP